jgi:serine/threonine protein kinase
MTDAQTGVWPRPIADGARPLDHRVRDVLDVLAREIETMRNTEGATRAGALSARLTHAVAGIHTSWKVLEKLSRPEENPAAQRPSQRSTSASPVISRSPRYQLGEQLGIGGMAEVFRGWQIGAAGFERPVAIKRILPKLAHDDRYRVMFTEEAHILARLAHPNIVSALDFVNDDGEPLLVLEHVDGVDLCKLMTSGPVPPSVTMFIAAELLSGLGYAHDFPGRDALGVVHCDLSPTNVLLSWDGAVKISDFGIAKLRSPTRLPVSRSREGKPGYMSPEQCRRQPLDGRADLFSLGVILWELLAGERLFPHDQPAITAERLNARRLPRPSELQAVPHDFERIVMKLLRRRRDRRYRTAETALDAVAACGGASMLRGRGELVELLARRFPAQAAQRPLKRPLPPTTPTPTIPLPKRARPAPRRSRFRSWMRQRRCAWRRRRIRRPARLWLKIAVAVVCFVLMLGLVAG